MEEDAKTVTTTVEEAMADLTGKILWVVFACASVGVVVLLETLFLNHGCTL